jgi:hypothetical protein
MCDVAECLDCGEVDAGPDPLDWALQHTRETGHHTRTMSPA